MRRASVFLAFLLGCSSAFAGDADKLSIIGFSKDANFFAFESYGVGDGSGLGYSDISVIDIKSNSWVPGSPVRMRGEDENQTQGVARAGALKLATPLLTKYGIDQPYEMLAFNPITEIIDNRKSIEFDSVHRSYGNATVKPGEPADNRFILQLTDFPVGATSNCLAEDGARFGFSLEIKQTQSGKAVKAYHDETVPTSRGCSSNYELEAIVSPDDESGSPVLIAIVAYYIQGFEGPDRKFIAVPFTLP